MLNSIVHGDAMELIKELQDESIDLVVTDPPYNIGGGNKRTKVGNKLVSNKEAWGKWDIFGVDEYDIFIFNILEECYRVLKDGGSLYFFTAREMNGYFCNYATRKVGFHYNNSIAMVKSNPLPSFSKSNYRNAFELAFFVSKGKPSALNFLSQKRMHNVYYHQIGSTKETKHPTEKPVNLFKKLILVSSNEEDVVLDPFMGSGTTAIASMQTNRNYIGFEMDDEYIEEINKRIKKEESKMNQTSLF